MNMLEIQNCTICYQNGTPAVSDVSLSVSEGEIVSIVGESGSGKTTVIRSILGLLPSGGKVTKGDILFEGESLLQYSKKQWRELRGTQISMIFQDSGAMMNPTKKIGTVFTEYIRTQEKIAKKEAWEKGITMLERMRLPAADNVMNSYPFQLSGGMARRVLISAAVLETPKLIVADEPTPGLSVDMAMDTLKHFRKIANTGTGILLITHDIDLAFEVADRIAVFYAGTVVEISPTEDFKKGKEYLRHPYSKAFLRALPQNEFQPIPGIQPYAGNLPEGCLFANRCPDVSEKCTGQIPMRELRGGKVRCVNAT
mgnify:CR=1 FL=1